VDLLIARGADLTIKDFLGRTPIEVARYGSLGDRVIHSLLAAGAPLPLCNPTVLCRIASISCTAIKSLLKHNVNVSDLRGLGRETPFHWAARRSAENVADVIDMLVKDAGVDLSVLNKNNHTCCFTAVERANVIALRCFIEHGADVDQADGGGWTPLQLACADSKQFECASLLIAAGADVCAKDGRGRSACHVATEVTRNKDLIAELIAAGASIDAMDNNGRTPRQIAASRGISELAAADELEAARRRIGRTRLSLVRKRAFQVCVGLQPLGLDALQMCKVLPYACSHIRSAHLVSFHHWWKIATTVKHFQCQSGGGSNVEK
jgi:ankyrin repeat protein